MLVADYSSGRPTPAQLKAAGFGGAVRYLRKRQPSSVAVLTESEALAFKQAKMPLALVYEDGAAGWMMGGYPVGAAVGAWALEQARAVGIEQPRCIYFADDVVHADTAQGRMEVHAVLSCLDGARAALIQGGLPASAAGIYGFRATLRASTTQGSIAYRWLTGSKPTDAEVRTLGLSLYQRNYGDHPDPGGVSCDVNDVLTPDWGQHYGSTGGTTLDAELKTYLDGLKADIIKQIHHDAGQIVDGDVGHLNNIARLRAELVTGFPAIPGHPAVPGLIPQVLAKLDEIAVGAGTPGAVADELAAVLERARFLVPPPAEGS